MKKIKPKKELLKRIFQNYPVFDLYAKHAIENLNCDLYVDDESNTETAILYAQPAYLLVGNPKLDLSLDIKEIIKSGGWIISPSKGWDELLISTFSDNLQSHPRILFDSSKIDIATLKANQKPLPEDLKIEPINSKHLEKGMIKEEIVDKFFINKNFLEHGFGFALVNSQGIVHGFSLTNYPVQTEDEVEVSYRVGYDSYQKYRNQGIGTTLASVFVEEAIKRGYDPVWDAANSVSSHIAKKLGYIEKTHWYMHHLK